MDKPLVTVIYKTADGKRIRLAVASVVRELLEQSDRQIRAQRRQDRRYLAKEEYKDGLTDTTTVCPHEDFADLLDRMDSYKRLYAALDKLSETQRRRVLMRYFGGLTYRRIADLEHVSRNAVRESVARAVHALRQYITK